MSGFRFGFGLAAGVFFFLAMAVVGSFFVCCGGPAVLFPALVKVNEAAERVRREQENKSINREPPPVVPESPSKVELPPMRPDPPAGLTKLQDREEALAESLALIKILIGDPTKIPAARIRLQKIVDDDPETKAAAEARKLLESLKGK